MCLLGRQNISFHGTTRKNTKKEFKQKNLKKQKLTPSESQSSAPNGIKKIILDKKKSDVVSTAARVACRRRRRSCVRLLRLERIQLQTNATGQSAFPNVRVKKQPKNLRRRKSITKKKKKMKKSKPNKPTNKKYKWPDTQLTPSQPVRQKKLKNTKREIFFGVWYILSNVIYVCPAFLSGWAIHLSYFQSIEKNNNTNSSDRHFVCLNFSL